MDGLLCHCWPEDETGHPLTECGTKIPTRLPGWPEIKRASNGPYGINLSQVKPRGTCPVCGKNAPVKRIEVRTTDRPDVHDLMPGVLVAIHPGMAPHKFKGAQCAGTGQVPAETRYRSAQLEAMLRDFGKESVA
jgi:hypothetical protein